MGDGAGVGKGRQVSWNLLFICGCQIIVCTQIAAIILENYVRGRCRHIWFSVSHDLKMDAERYVCVCVSVLCVKMPGVCGINLSDCYLLLEI